MHDAPRVDAHTESHPHCSELVIEYMHSYDGTKITGYSSFKSQAR